MSMYVVTGAASGLGAATAERLHAAGHGVIGVDLRGTDVEADLGRLSSDGWLADDALVVVERDARSSPPTWPEEFDLIVEKVYGETRVEIGRFTP